uniref:Uncharacterized protein n=1 Tax=Chromera velia CCMP2878 TaxID=1169474 RepID=A0A0G4HCD0_9ALVE|eukprot:Cvel_26046.t1-p1 / transcript=Cvel_26046.t1 / gene=Cvel_26046 / organism=Chromera_velia_CCMP2878 / gene_product=hypothetical protein / transcript_product=hypothetical protein / location=Cvel_scaffold3036:11742-12254(+) / protein_length=171 / sequence_SO=supercontig / SO=protein_coding / is_pseudo=false
MERPSTSDCDSSSGSVRTRALEKEVTDDGVGHYKKEPRVPLTRGGKDKQELPVKRVAAVQVRPNVESANMKTSQARGEDHKRNVIIAVCVSLIGLFLHLWKRVTKQSSFLPEVRDAEEADDSTYWVKGGGQQPLYAAARLPDALAEWERTLRERNEEIRGVDVFYWEIKFG